MQHCVALTLTDIPVAFTLKNIVAFTLKIMCTYHGNLALLFIVLLWEFAFIHNAYFAINLPQKLSGIALLGMPQKYTDKKLLIMLNR